MGCAALRFWAIGGAAHLHMDTKHADRRSNCLRPLLSHAMAEVRARQQVGGGGCTEAGRNQWPLRCLLADVARSMAATIHKPSGTQAGSGCQGWIGAPYICPAAYAGTATQKRNGKAREVPGHQCFLCDGTKFLSVKLFWTAINLLYEKIQQNLRRLK